MPNDVVERILNLKSENMGHKFLNCYHIDITALVKVTSSICSLLFLYLTNILDTISNVSTGI